MKTQSIKVHFNKFKIYYLLVFWLLSLLIMWVSKQTAVSGIEQSYGNKIDSIEYAKDLHIDSLTLKHMTMNMKSISWAIRGELIRGNMEQVEQYVYLLIQNKGIYEASLINSENEYWISSNKKNEGMLISDQELIKVIVKKTATVIKTADGYIASSPIMSLDDQLGTIILKFN